MTPDFYYIRGGKLTATTVCDRLLMYKFTIKRKPMPKLARRKIGPLAQARHRELYTALAE